jgi:excisionase family DNA binding protein
MLEFDNENSQGFVDNSLGQDEQRHNFSKPLSTLSQVLQAYQKKGLVGVRYFLEARYVLQEDKLAWLIETGHELIHSGTPDMKMGRMRDPAVLFALTWCGQRVKELEQLRLGLAFEQGRTQGLDLLAGLEQDLRAKISALEGVAIELSARAVGKNGEVLTKEVPTNKAKNAMSQREAAKYLNISKPTLIAREKEGKIVSYRPSVGRVVYLQEDLDAYLKSTATQK